MAKSGADDDYCDTDDESTVSSAGFLFLREREITAAVTAERATAAAIHITMILVFFVIGTPLSLII